MKHLSLTDEQLQTIADLVLAGKNIEAIKTYREITGEGLAEGKDFIDEIARELNGVEESEHKGVAAGSGLDDEVLEKMKQAIIKGNSILAIKYYREATGAGLKDGKTFVDAYTQQIMDEDPNLEIEKGGCFGMILLGSRIPLASYFLG